MSGSSVGSSSEVNSSVSLATTENMQKKLEEFDELRESPTWKQQWISHTIVQGISPPEAAASLEAYTSYASSSLKQRKRIITQAMKKSTCKSTKKKATYHKEKRKEGLKRQPSQNERRT
jgi:hypothetical protein